MLYDDASLVVRTLININVHDTVIYLDVDPCRVQMFMPSKLYPSSIDYHHKARTRPGIFTLAPLYISACWRSGFVICDTI